MRIEVAITLGISIAGFVFAVIGKIIALSVKFGKFEERMKLNEERDVEERAKASVKFSELYSRMSSNESDVNSLKTSMLNITATCNRIESKLDRLLPLQIQGAKQ